MLDRAASVGLIADRADGWRSGKAQAFRHGGDGDNSAGFVFEDAAVREDDGPSPSKDESRLKMSPHGDYAPHMRAADT
jgi:hypothetical protein